MEKFTELGLYLLGTRKKDGMEREKNKEEEEEEEDRNIVDNEHALLYLLTSS